MKQLPFFFLCLLSKSIPSEMSTLRRKKLILPTDRSYFLLPCPWTNKLNWFRLIPHLNIHEPPTKYPQEEILNPRKTHEKNF